MRKKVFFKTTKHSIKKELNWFFIGKQETRLQQCRHLFNRRANGSDLVREQSVAVGHPARVHVGCVIQRWQCFTRVRIVAVWTKQHVSERKESVRTTRC